MPQHEIEWLDAGREPPARSPTEKTAARLRREAIAWALIERATRAVELDQGHSGGTGSLNFRRALVREMADEAERAGR